MPTHGVHRGRLKGLDLAEICITSGGDLVEGRGAGDGAFTLADVAGVGVVPALAEGEKCERCWQVLPEVGKSARHPLLCERCDEAVAASMRRIESPGDGPRRSSTLVGRPAHQAAAARLPAEGRRQSCR